MCDKKHSRLWLYFSGVVFATVAVVFLLVSVIWLALFETGAILFDPRDRHIPILVFLLLSLLLGVVIALFVGRTIIRPIQNISNAFGELARGNFSVRVSDEARLAEIREMARRFNAMSYDLSHIETLRSDFVANVSHEFKTPISSISGYATLLQNHGLPEEKRDYYIEKILDNSRRLSTLSTNILLLSKLENQELVMGGGEFRLDEQIRRAILMLEDQWTGKEIEFDLELPRQMYRGSEAMLERVWSNLIDNAIKYSDRGGVIHVTLDRGQEALRVTIADEGIGMSEEMQKHIFEKFYQGDTSRREEGSGLGLALVKRIVDLCRGEVAVKSAPGQGTMVTVGLPLDGE